VSKYEKPQEIFGWVASAMGVDNEKNRVLKQFYNRVSNFSLTEKEQNLLTNVRTSPEQTYKKMGEKLNVSEETLKKHAKNIIQKTKIAFPFHFPKNEKTSLKQVGEYLLQLDYVTD
jgi:DNA-binding CsgD family transcriptional regulator